MQFSGGRMSCSKEKRRRKPSAVIINILAVLAVGVIVYIGANTDFGLIWSYACSMSPALFLLLICL